MYANKYWLTNLLDYEELQKRYTIWVAQYSDNCTYKGKYDMWQKSSSGKIEGINGYVDLDEMFRDLISDVANSEQNVGQNSQNVGQNSQNVGQNIIEYKVKQGDTLSEIAQNYNTSIEKIAKANNIVDVNKIYAGQILKIETSNGQIEVTYKVKRGDTLSQIAQNYNTTVEKIAKDNNIANPNIIFVGQILKIKR